MEAFEKLVITCFEALVSFISVPKHCNAECLI